LKEEALDCNTWRARFGRGFGPVVRQTTNKWDTAFPISQQIRCNNFSSLLLDVYSYVQLNMFQASSRPSSGAQHLQ
jgi:hypothetical protein